MMAMSEADEYRANALECERMLQICRDEDRSTWLKLREHWLRMWTEAEGTGQTKSEESN